MARASTSIRLARRPSYVDSGNTLRRASSASSFWKVNQKATPPTKAMIPMLPYSHVMCGSTASGTKAWPMAELKALENLKKGN